MPEDGQLPIEPRGNLAAMMTAAQQTKSRQKRAASSCRINWLRGSQPAEFGVGVVGGVSVLVLGHDKLRFATGVGRRCSAFMSDYAR
jgi:hypothetical protein